MGSVLRVLARIMLTVVATIALGLAVGYAYESYAAAREAEQHPAPGTLVELSGRRVHILCKGEGPGPTVVIEPGSAEPSMLWWGVQDEIAKFARVCTYDRAGYQWSDTATAPRSITDRAHELRAVVQRANIPGPYVFVAHSYGGAIVRTFAREYPADTAGLVLVDTPDEKILFGRVYASIVARGRWVLAVAAFAMRCGVVRAWSAVSGENDDGMQLSPEARKNWAMAFTPAALDAARDEMASIANATPAERAESAPGSFGALPILVVAHGQPFPPPFDILEPGFRESQQRLAALSSEGELVIADRSNHNINMDQPGVIVAAVRRVVEKVRNSPTAPPR